MQIPIQANLWLTEFERAHKATLVERLNDPAIYQNSLRIPHPYTEADFDQWIGTVEEKTQALGEPTQFAILENGSPIGGVGFDGLTKGHRAEIGYWLAKAWWGRGIMTTVVGAACEYAFSRWKLVRITAHVFQQNPASARVLEKNGFQEEGLLRKHHLKDGRFLDSRLFALVR